MAKITDIMLLQQPDRHALVIEHQTDMKTFSRLIGEGFMKIGGYMEEQGEITTDIPFVEYPGYDEISEDSIHMIIGNYTAKAIPGKEDIKSIVIPARKIAVCLHKGNYDELAELYKEMVEWTQHKGYEPNGTSIEHYYTGPEVPESEHITRVVMPLK